MEIQQPEDFPFLGVVTGCDRGLVFGEIPPVQDVTGIRTDAVFRKQFGHFIGDRAGVGIGGDQGFMVKKDLGVSSAKDLASASAFGRLP